MICSNPRCGAENPPGNAFCLICGQPIEGGRPAPPPAPSAKRRTQYEPDGAGPVLTPSGAAPQPSGAGSPSGGFGGVAPRPPVNPSNPFAWNPPPQAPSAGTGPSPNPSAVAVPSRKNATIVDPGRNPLPQVEGALFVYARADDEGTVHALRSGRNVIGRDPACDVLVNDPRVSGNHALIFLKPEETTYVDTSANGSLVDGKVIHGDTARIANGAVIDVGDARLIFVRVPRELVDAPRP